MANRELADKRAQALHLTKRATHKISRLKTKVDVIVAGSEFDPRKPPKLVARYTTKQLEAYINRVAQFNNRATQFVPDAHRRPIPAAEFKELHVAELAHQKRAHQELNKVKDIKLPGRPETVGQRRAQMVENRRRMAGNPSVNDPYDPPVRDSKQIANRKALKKLTQDAKKKAQKGWDDKELKRQIGEFQQIIDRVGDAGGMFSIKELTPGQFKALWNSTPFADAMATRYEVAQLMIAGKDKPSHQRIEENAFSDAKRLIDWAKTLNL